MLKELENDFKQIKSIENSIENLHKDIIKLKLEKSHLINLFYNKRIKLYGDNFKFRVGDFVKIINYDLDNEYEELKCNGLIFKIAECARIERHMFELDYDKSIFMYVLLKIEGVNYNCKVDNAICSGINEYFLEKVTKQEIENLKNESNDKQ